MTDIRVLSADQLGIIGRIDRTEHIDTIVTVARGSLVSRAVDIAVPRWRSEGHGPHSVEGLVDALEPVLERGATLLGAFDCGDVVGVAVVEERFEGDMAWLAFLHVSNGFRRRGIGTALWAAAVGRARAAGARRIYVSATPSASAVGFYIARGCELALVPHPDLHAEEPDDIHLVAAIE